MFAAMSFCAAILNKLISEKLFATFFTRWQQRSHLYYSFFNTTVISVDI